MDHFLLKFSFHSLCRKGVVVIVIAGQGGNFLGRPYQFARYRRLQADFGPYPGREIDVAQGSF